MKEGVKVQEQAAGVHVKDFKRCMEVTEVMVLEKDQEGGKRGHADTTWSFVGPF